MRIAVLSDIHGNRTAFDAVVADLRAISPDLILHGGDLAQGGSSPAYIIDAIQNLGWPGVMGNVEEVLWAPERLDELASRVPALRPLMACIRETVVTTRDWLGQDRIAWLRALPQVLCEGRVAIIHASPESLWRSPLAAASDAELESAYASLAASVVTYGHIHTPFVRPLEKFTVANSGSVGMPYDADPRASYLLIDAPGSPAARPQVTIRRVAYDIEAECCLLAQSGLPHADWVAHILKAGQYVAPF